MTPRFAHAAWLAVALLPVVEMGCKRPPPPRELAEAPDYEWSKDDGGVALVFYPNGGRPTYELSFVRDEDALALEVACNKNCANQVTFQIGHERAVLHRSGTQKIAGDFKRQLAEVELSQLSKPVLELNPSFEMTITFQNAKPVTVMLQKPMPAPPDLLDGWIDGKVQIADPEPADDGETSALLFYDSKRASEHKLFGNGKKLTDLDWIVVAQGKPTGRPLKCAVSGLGQFTIEAVDALLTVYDRRTGKVEKEHRLEAPAARCESVTVRDLSQKTFVSPVPRGLIDKWVQSEVVAAR